jgi:hypothetical protein
MFLSRAGMRIRGSRKRPERLSRRGSGKASALLGWAFLALSGHHLGSEVARPVWWNVVVQTSLVAPGRHLAKGRIENKPEVRRRGRQQIRL